MKGNLSLFWEIASSNEDARLTSANQLVQELLSQQDVLASSSKITLDPPSAFTDNDNDFGETPSPLIVSDEEADAVEEAIGNRTVADLMYAMRRLLRGLASPRESSRLGFAVVLTELLSRISNVITAREVLILILKYSNPQGAASRQERKDLLFAKLFGIMVLVQSRLLFQPSSSLSDFKRSMRVLFFLMQDKVWMAESCAWVMSNAISECKQNQDLEWAQDAQSWMLAQLSASKELTSEKLALLLKLGQGAEAEFWQKHAPNSLRKEHPLSPANLPQLAKILKEAIPSENEEGDVGARTRWQVKIHFVWDIILDTFFSDSSSASKLASFPDFYQVVVDETLFAASSSNDRKSWGFQVFERSLPRAKDSDKPLLFTPNFMRTLINQLSKSDRILHKAAIKATQTVQEVVKSKPQLGFVLVTQLIGENGHKNFDSITKTKTVEQVLASLDTDRVREYVKHLCNAICVNAADPDEDDLIEIANRRRWAFDQLVFLVRTSSIPKDEGLLAEILTFMAAHGYFVMTKPVKKQFLLDTVPVPEIDDSLKQYARARFISCVSELSTSIRIVSNADGTKKKTQGTTKSGELWLFKAHSILSKLDKDATFKSIFDQDEEIAEKLAEGVKCLEKIRKLEANTVELVQKDRLRAFQSMLLSALLVSADAADGASDLVEPLCACAEKLFFAAKGGKSKKSSATEDSGSELSGIEIFCDCLLSFLELSSAFLRATAAHAFESFASEMSKASLKLLMSSLQIEDVEEEGEENTEDEEMEDDEDEDDEAAARANGKPSDTSATSSDDEMSESGDEGDIESDLDGEVEVDEELRARVRAVLKESGMAHGDDKDGRDSDQEVDVDEEEENDDDDDAASESSVEFSDMDDDQMMLMDDKLAEVFRQRVAAVRDQKDAKREASALRMKILELVEIFANKESKNGLVLDVIHPLFELYVNHDKDSEQLGAKVRAILTKQFAMSKSVPIDFDVAQATTLLERMHKELLASKSKELSGVAQSVSLFLTKAALAKDVNLTTALNSKLVEIYRRSLLACLTTARYRLRPDFLIEAFSRFPQLGWHFSKELLEYCRPGAAASVHHQMQALHLLQTTLAQMSSRPEKEEILSILPEISRCFCEIVTKSTEPEASAWSLKAAGMKELVKFLLQAVRISKKVEPSATKLRTAWKMPKLKEANEKLQACEKFKDTNMIRDSMKQLFKMLDDAPLEPGKKRHEKASKGGQGQKKRVGEDPAAGGTATGRSTSAKKMKTSKETS